MLNRITHSISKYSFLIGSVISIAAVTIVSTIWFLKEIENFKSENKFLKKVFTQNQERTLKFETNKVIDYITVLKLKEIKKTEKSIKENVYKGINIAYNLYKKYKRIKPAKEIKEIIAESLRPIRFFDGRGYFFIVQLDGTKVLHPISPELEGTKLVDLKDTNERLSIQKEIELIKSQKEGYVNYFWSKHNIYGKKDYEKIAYIKSFPPYDWYVGCGEYVDETAKSTKKFIIDIIAQIPLSERGALFILEKNGTVVFSNFDLYNSVSNIRNLAEAKGNNILQKKLDIIKKPGSGIITYSLKTEKDSLKNIMSYVTYYKDFDWIVGINTDYKYVTDQIELKKKKLNSSIKKQLIKIILIYLTTLAITFSLGYLMRKRIRSSFEMFTNELTNSLKISSPLNPNSHYFNEFKEVAQRTNMSILQKNKLEKELAETTEIFKTIFENAPILIDVKDLKGNYLFANREYKKMYEFSDPPSSSQKNHFVNIFPDPDTYRTIMEDTLKANGIFKEYKSIDKNGKERVQRWANFKTKSNIIGVGFDITELKKKERALKVSREDLKEANAAKNKFFSIIAHDLRSPFNVLLGYTTLLINRYSKYDDRKKLSFIKKINETSESIFNLVENLLLWSRTQSQRINIEPVYFSLSEIAEDLIKINEIVLKRKSIALTNEIDPNLIVFGDKNMTYTVLRNLVSNSIKFTNENGKICLLMESFKTYVRIGVSDTGVGISLADQEKLFTLKDKRPVRTAGDESGTGLGLIICKEFIEMNNGKIWVESIKGKGSTFYFTLPLQSPKNLE